MLVYNALHINQINDYLTRLHLEYTHDLRSLTMIQAELICCEEGISNLIGNVSHNLLC